jgi:hypothetical protein
VLDDVAHRHGVKSRFFDGDSLKIANLEVDAVFFFPGFDGGCVEVDAFALPPMLLHQMKELPVAATGIEQAPRLEVRAETSARTRGAPGKYQ